MNLIPQEILEEILFALSTISKDPRDLTRISLVNVHWNKIITKYNDKLWWDILDKYVSTFAIQFNYSN
jgi:hypothetical protein